MKVIMKSFEMKRKRQPNQRVEKAKIKSNQNQIEFPKTTRTTTIHKRCVETIQ